MNLDKPAQTDGLAMTSDGDLYFSGVTKNTIYSAQVINEKKNDLKYEEVQFRIVAQDNSSLIWADTFSIDNYGSYVWVTTRGWPIDLKRNSIVRVYIDSKSYLYDN